MGLDFAKKEPQPVMEVQEVQEMQAVQEYDIAADREKMNQQLVNSAEVDALASQIEVYNMESIVSFGASAAEEISKASDIVLNSMNMAQIDESRVMLDTLAKIMSKFDIEEIKEKPGLFARKDIFYQFMIIIHIRLKHLFQLPVRLLDFPFVPFQLMIQLFLFCHY